MPIQLSSPKSTGDLDKEASEYSEAKIVSVTINLVRKSILCAVSYGNTVEGKWTKGIIPNASFEISNRAERLAFDPDTGEPGSVAATTDYDDLIAQLPANTEESLYDQVAKALYQYLIDKGHVEGTLI